MNHIKMRSLFQPSAADLRSSTANIGMRPSATFLDSTPYWPAARVYPPSTAKF